jgi:DNA mismatch repair protein MutS2
LLVGERVEPALDRLDTFLDRSLLAGVGEVRIIHGYGSGRLRQAVREHLRRHRAIASQRAGGEGEGGDGATVATLVG